MAFGILQQDLHRLRARGTAKYRFQRKFVAFAFQAMGGLLEAASLFDEPLRREVAGFPEGLVIGFSILGDTIGFRLRCQQGRLVCVADSVEAQLEITFKHVSHAFMVLSAQESTPRAYARQRLLTQGDPALSLRFMRCLNRVQAMALPHALAARAMKAVPPIRPGEKVKFTVHALRAHRQAKTMRSSA